MLVYCYNIADISTEKSGSVVCILQVYDGRLLDGAGGSARCCKVCQKMMMTMQCQSLIWFLDMQRVVKLGMEVLW